MTNGLDLKNMNWEGFKRNVGVLILFLKKGKVDWLIFVFRKGKKGKVKSVLLF